MGPMMSSFPKISSFNSLCNKPVDTSESGGSALESSCVSCCDIQIKDSVCIFCKICMGNRFSEIEDKRNKKKFK